MKIGVLGANGFVGRNLCSKFLDKGDIVYAFFNHSNNLIPNKCIINSINDPFNDELDCLMVSIGNYASIYEECLSQLFSLKETLDKIKFKRLVFISSISVYGNHTNVIDIGTAYNNPGLYGMSKLTQEFLIRSYPNYSIIRPTYLYGNGMNTNSLLPRWVSNAISNKKIIIYGDGLRKQDYLHINDLTELCWLAANNEQNNTVIAATGSSITNLYLAEKIADYIPDINIQLTSEDLAPSFAFNVSDTLSTYNWKPIWSFDEGLKHYIKNEGIDIQ